MKKSPLFTIDAVSKRFSLENHSFFALKNISLKGYSGETLGIVGESGCGKSTLAKALLFLDPPDQGSISFLGKQLGLCSDKEMRSLRKNMQIIFQDPDAALNPRMTLFEHLKESLSIHSLLSKKNHHTQIAALIEQVHLPEALLHRYPYELSGGQKQRFCIARALSVEPKLIVCDEPLASLDTSVRMQILQLLQELQEKAALSLLFITHDLTTLHYIAHSIAVLYLGHLMEYSPSDALYKDPLHPYTQILLESIPHPDPKKERERIRVILNEEPPSPINPPSGCVFHTRCPHASAICTQRVPELQEYKENHWVACHLYDHKSGIFKKK